MSTRRDLLPKYRSIIDQVKVSEPPDKNTTFVRAVKDKFNKGVQDQSATAFNMFVDDSLFCQTVDNIKHAMAASIEALYIILGFPETDIRQNALSLDKYFESTCSYERIQLGIAINTRKMTVALTEQKRKTMLDELSNWHKKRKSFTLLQGVTLCGSLEFWANTSPWIRFIYLNLRSAVNRSITFCSDITKNKRKIKNLITELSTTKGIDNYEQREKFVQSKIARETYKCNDKAHITNPMRNELKIMKKILSSPDKYKLETPIAHIINREPDFTTFGDASLEAAGGFSEELFWWHFEWPSNIKLLTLKNISVNRRCNITKDLVSINLLEFVVEIINYAAITVFFAENSSICEHEYPFLLNWTDNKTAKAWLRKAATKTEKGKSLQRILCSIMINNPMGVKSDYIKGEKNVIADFISRIFSSQNTAVTFDNLFVKFPQIEYWKRFHPSQELLSHLCSALLTGQDLGILEIKNLGHFSPGKSTS